MPFFEIAEHLGAAAAIAAVLGFERELRGQFAGLRTHIIVSLGACLFTYCGVRGFLVSDGPPLLAQDITRVASQVVVGIGFLGGGAILRHGDRIRGLTTAANLWLTAAVGLSCGLGLYAAAAATAALSLAALVLLRPLEGWLYRNRIRDHASERVPDPEEKF